MDREKKYRSHGSYAEPKLYKKDVEALRKSLRVGDFITMKIGEDEFGEAYKRKRLRIGRITGIYPYLVTVDAGEKARPVSITYVDMLLDGMRGGE